MHTINSGTSSAGRGGAGGSGDGSIAVLPQAVGGGGTIYCRHERCPAVAVFAYEGDALPTYCGTHRPLDMLELLSQASEYPYTRPG